MNEIKENKLIEPFTYASLVHGSLSKSEDHGLCFKLILSFELNSILITCKWLRKVSHDVIFMGASYISSLIVEEAY